MNLKNLQQSYLCELPNTARRRWHSPDATLLALAVTAVRASLLDRVACGRLAGRFAAAAARRELAGHLLCVPHIWRNRSWSSTGIRAAAGLWWSLSIMNLSIVVHLAQPSSLDMLVLVGKVGCAGRLQRDEELVNRPREPCEGDAVTACGGRGDRVRGRRITRSPRPPPA
jgi:hypothetical protein